MSETSSKRLNWLLCILLVTAVVAVYVPVAWFGFVSFDDPDYVTQNTRVRLGMKWENVAWFFTHSHAANWHPLTWISHMLDCQLFGLWAGGHHVVNVALHAANTVLVFLFLRLLTQARWRAFVVAGLFGLHPLRVESVAWVAERKDVLSAFFGLLCLCAYARYAQLAGPDAEGAKNPRKAWFYLSAIVLFALGLMSKAMLVTLPCVFLLLDYWPLGRVGRSTWRLLLLEKLPFAGLTLAASASAIWAEAGHVSLLPGSSSSQFSNVAVQYGLYMCKLMWPRDLAVLYPEVLQWPARTIALATATLACISLVVCWNWRKRPWLLVGMAWFAGMLIPVLGMVKMGVYAIADRYTYLPAVGFFIAVVWTAAEFLRPTGETPALGGAPGRRRLLSGVAPHGFAWLGGMAATVLLTFCALASSRQVFYWVNSRVLFQHAVAVTSNNYIAHEALAFGFGENKEWRQARQQARRALEINPTFDRAWDELALISLEEHKPEDSIRDCQQALRCNPKSGAPHGTLGQAYLRLGQTNEAIAEYDVALQMNPELADVYYNRANIFAAQGRFAEAKQDYAAAVRVNPFSADFHNNFGFMLAREGDLRGAISEFEQTIRLRPNSWRAHYGLADALVKVGEPARAAEEFAETLRQQPGFSIARVQLGMCLAAQGRLEQAEAELQTAVREQPQSPTAQFQLASIMERQGRVAESMEHLREVLRLKPNFPEASNRLAALVGSSPGAKR